MPSKVIATNTPLNHGTSGRVCISDGISNGGTYVLRIRVKRRLRIAFGRFKGGKEFVVEPGNYCYIGSALSEKGATTLALRLIRHATRTGNKPPQNIRAELLRTFVQLGMIQTSTPNNGKNFRWNVDHLLDREEAELIAVFGIRSPKRIEAALGRLLDDDVATSVICRGLGANDIPGNTHLLRVDADERWWQLLPLRMQSLVGPPKADNLVEAYLLGRHCLRGNNERGPSGRISFAKGTQGRKLAADLSLQLGVSEMAAIKDAKFAEAVDTVIGNCGPKAVRAIFFSQFPQDREEIESLARTSDSRQCYRVDGVLDGRFPSLGQEGDDPVYDTVKFYEVVSRLARAAGLLRVWKTRHRQIEKRWRADAHRLIEACRLAAKTLQVLLGTNGCVNPRVSTSIARESVAKMFADISAPGRLTGNLKAALKLIAKNVWDFVEMRQRGIEATEHERAKALDKIAIITELWA